MRRRLPTAGSSWRRQCSFATSWNESTRLASLPQRGEIARAGQRSRSCRPATTPFSPASVCGDRRAASTRLFCSRTFVRYDRGVEYLQPYLHQAGVVPSVALVIAVCILLRSLRRTMWRVALLALPGTIAHELTHLIVGLVLRARPHGFSVWPRAQGNGWRLGSVSFQRIGLLNG